MKFNLAQRLLVPVVAGIILYGAAAPHVTAQGHAWFRHRALPNAVAAGDVTPTSAVLWARSDRGKVLFLLRKRTGFWGPRWFSVAVPATPEIPAKVQFTGLTPDTDYWYAVLGLSFAAIPTALLMLSAGNSLRRSRTRSLILCGLLIAICASFTCWLGEEDNWRRVIEIDLGGTGPQPTGLGPLEVSWFWLLTPIILTTAFVIFGAWRRAVRDADVEAVGEDAEE